jgi:CheY-like chemotaxis protein
MKIRSAPGRGSTFLIAVPDDRMPEAGEARREDKTQKADDRLDLSAPLGPPSPGSPVRVLLADDHKIVREGLAALISEQEDIEVVGQATNGLEAVHLAHELHPDVVVMDVAMPMMPGDEATRQIKRDMPQTRVLGLSMHEEAGVAERMHDAGAEGYMIKTAPSEELLAAIRGAGGIQERVAKGPC